MVRNVSRKGLLEETGVSTLKLKHADVLSVYRLMCRTRALQEELIINRRAINGPLLTAIGSEAVSVPAFCALAKRGILENSVFCSPSS